MFRAPALERVALDASALLGDHRRYIIAAAALHYFNGYWSPWIIAEFVRKRTEWIAERAANDGCDRTEMRRRLRDSRTRINALVVELSRLLLSVNYADAPPVDLSWLTDPDDLPVMQTALAANANILVTDNSGDFPLGQQRNGVLFLGSRQFLSVVFDKFPDAEAAVREYLQES